MTRVLACLVLISQVAAAQGRPDFSGSWTIDLPPAVVAGGDYGFGSSLAGAMVAGTQATITQDARQLTITRVIGSTRTVLKVNLDGSETENIVPALGGPLTEKSKAEWIGQRLRIQTEIAAPTRTTAIQELSRAGNVLTVEHWQLLPKMAPRTHKYRAK